MDDELSPTGDEARQHAAKRRRARHAPTERAKREEHPSRAPISSQFVDEPRQLDERRRGRPPPLPQARVRDDVRHRPVDSHVDEPPRGRTRARRQRRRGRKRRRKAFASSRRSIGSRAYFTARTPPVGSAGRGSGPGIRWGPPWTGLAGWVVIAGTAMSSWPFASNLVGGRPVVEHVHERRIRGERRLHHARGVRGGACLRLVRVEHDERIRAAGVAPGPLEREDPGVLFRADVRGRPDHVRVPRRSAAYVLRIRGELGDVREGVAGRVEVARPRGPRGSRDRCRR